MATPREVRQELKKRNLHYDIFKIKSCWYVSGEGTEMWYDRSVGTYSFSGASAAFWVNVIEDKIKENSVED